MTRFLFAFIALATVPVAQALDYKSLSDNAIAYDACSVKATPQYILLKGTPVEQIIAVDKWVKIREQSGSLACVERSSVSDVRTVIVLGADTPVRAQASDSAPVVFSAAKNVLLEMLEKPTGAWVKVKHRDGQTGFVSISAIWGI